jgi:hypothetical protein
MKINNKLLLACALTITGNSFGMLTKTSFQIKKIKSFCTKTSSHDHPLIFKKEDLNISTKDNRALLREIIEQNKEINDLLRATLKQNALHFYIQHNYLFKMPTAGHYGKLSALYKSLEKKYNLKINTKE